MDSEDVEENVEEDDVEVVGTGAVVLTVPVSLNGGKLVVAPVARVDTISPPSSRKVPLPSWQHCGSLLQQGYHRGIVLHAAEPHCWRLFRCKDRSVRSCHPIPGLHMDPSPINPLDRLGCDIVDWIDRLLFGRSRRWIQDRACCLCRLGRQNRSMLFERPLWRDRRRTTTMLAEQVLYTPK